MAGPLAGISAQQIAQQKLPEQAQQQGNKAGASKFDQSLKSQGAAEAHQAQHAQAAQQVNQTQNVNQIDKARQVEATNKAQKAELLKVKGDKTAIRDAVSQKREVSKSTSLITDMVSNMEKGQVAIDKLINGGLTGRNFSNQEMLALQAGMYKYSQELELTSKVVEKATSGLKDTLKTQV